MAKNSKRRRERFEPKRPPFNQGKQIGQALKGRYRVGEWRKGSGFIVFYNDRVNDERIAAGSLNQVAAAIVQHGSPVHGNNAEAVAAVERHIEKSGIPINIKETDLLSIIGNPESSKPTAPPGFEDIVSPKFRGPSPS